MRDDWWKQAVVYQIYPRSFKDVNGDGLGDIAGVTEKMDYLKNLGIDAIWLSPFYPSDLADGGYDVIDYRNVDPRLGTMADFDAMAAAAHEAGIKVIVDIVPNHTSNKHKMFIEALADGGVKCGLPRAKAVRYAAQMIAGSAEMVLRSGKHPGLLKDEVCSPGGSTIAGVDALEQHAFRGSCIAAVEAAFEKTRQLG